MRLSSITALIALALAARALPALAVSGAGAAAGASSLAVQLDVCSAAQQPATFLEVSKEVGASQGSHP